MPKSQTLDPIPPIENIFFREKKIPSVSIHHKPLKKHQPIRFLAFLLFSTLPSVYLHVMIPYFLSEKYTKKRKICVAGPPRSLFGPVSMFSGLTPFPPIRDGRIPQFVKPWLYSSSKMIPRCKEDHKISIRELYDFLLVFFASY